MRAFHRIGLLRREARRAALADRSRTARGGAVDIQQIKYFSRVYEMRSFTQAADSLFISRQALRKSVARLAQEMGEPLFENRGNVLFPTSAADLLFSASRPVLSAFAQMEAELNLGKLKSQGIVRFGQSVEASDVMTSGEMRQVIDFSSTSELVTKGMRFTEANCVELRQLEGDLDYASLIATVVNESLFDYDTAIGGRIHIAVRTDDPLAEKSFIRLEDLEGRPFTSQGAGFDVHDRLVEATEERGVKLNIVCTRSGLHNRLEMVQTGVTLTYAYRDLRFPRVAPDVVCIPLEESPMKWFYCTIAKKGLGDPYLLRFFSGKEDFVLWKD